MDDDRGTDDACMEGGEGEVTERSADVATPTSLLSLSLGGRVGVELGGITGPDNSKGSSVGLGGGMGALRSISGSSILISGAGTMILSDFFPFAVLCLVFDLRLEDFEMVGVMTTSLGGVNTSVGGSYGGMGVVRRARADVTERWVASTGISGIKSASGFRAWGDLTRRARFCWDGVVAGDILNDGRVGESLDAG